LPYLYTKALNAPFYVCMRQQGETPLHVAAYWARTDIARMLLIAGSSPVIKDKVCADAVATRAAWARQSSPILCQQQSR
jgi:hypothetical protein